MIVRLAREDQIHIAEGVHGILRIRPRCCDADDSAVLREQSYGPVEEIPVEWRCGVRVSRHAPIMRCRGRGCRRGLSNLVVDSGGRLEVGIGRSRERGASIVAEVTISSTF